LQGPAKIKEIPFTGGIIVVDYSIDRVQIKHDTKPEKAIIDNLKHSGFRWSPSNTAWQRQITPAALYSVQKVTGINIQS
jgi:hypothetical protein